MVVLEMFFLVLSNIDIKFDTRKQTWRRYVIAVVIPITRCVEQIKTYKFVKLTLDQVLKTFVVYVAILEAFRLIMTLYLIRKLLLAALK